MRNSGHGGAVAAVRVAAVLVPQHLGGRVIRQLGARRVVGIQPDLRTEQSLDEIEQRRIEEQGKQGTQVQFRTQQCRRDLRPLREYARQPGLERFRRERGGDLAAARVLRYQFVDQLRQRVSSVRYRGALEERAQHQVAMAPEVIQCGVPQVPAHAPRAVDRLLHRGRRRKTAPRVCYRRAHYGARRLAVSSNRPAPHQVRSRPV